MVSRKRGKPLPASHRADRGERVFRKAGIEAGRVRTGVRKDQSMELVQLGQGGRAVAAVGLGCMRMSGMYGAADRTVSIATIHAAVDAGVTSLDTGDFYGMGHSEISIGEAIRNRPRDSFSVSVKFGAQRDPRGGWIGYDARPAAVKTWSAYTLQRSGSDHIDIYRPARLDPSVPIEETVGAIAEMIEAGYVRYIGSSE
ncbi:hypothetical protein OY671_008417, partial [Metschnikowia pulcherrima]